MIDQLVDYGTLVAEIALLFFAVTVAVQLVQARFGPDRMRSWMGGKPATSAMKGIALGFATPFCTFTAIPMLVGLRQARVPAAGFVAFIIAAPVLDPVLFGALAIIAGIGTAVLYASIALVAALALAIVAEHIHIERLLTPIDSLVGAAELECESSCSVRDSWGGIGGELRPASAKAVSLLRGMTPILVAGLGLSVLIEAAVPPEVTQRLTAASPSLSVPIAAALGTPLYVSTAVFVPVADALAGAGVGMGAIVALTIAGAGANLPEFVILAKLARPRVIGVFFAYVFGVAATGGFITQAVIG